MLRPSSTEQTVQELLRPRKSANTGYLRCADLYCGDGAMAEAALKADFEIAYAYDPDTAGAEAYTEKFGIEPFWGNTHESINLAPDFHVLLMWIGSDALTVPEQPRRAKIRKFDTPVEHTMRFLYVRRPVAFLIIGDDLPDGLIEDILNTISTETVRWGYTLDHRVLGKSGAIAGVVHPTGPISWPEDLALEPTVWSLSCVSLASGIRSEML